MKSKPHLLTHKLKKWALSLACTLLCAVPAHAQWGFGIYGGPGIQSIFNREPTITDPYLPRVLPQFGAMAMRHMKHGITLRGGLGYEISGTKYDSFSPMFSYSHYWIRGRVDYLKAFAGASCGGDLSQRIALSGFTDIAFGIPTLAKFTESADDVLKVKYRNGGQAYANYLGLNLGLSLRYRFSTYIWLQISPTFQTQVNRALGENGPNLHFGGFVPRIEFGYDLPSKHKNMPVMRGNKKLYLEHI